MRKFNGLALPSGAVEILHAIIHRPTQTAFLARQVIGDGPERCELVLTGETFTAAPESLGINACVSRVMALRGWTDRKDMGITTAYQRETRPEFQL